MHRGLVYWPKTGVVYDANADYVCPPYTGCRGDNLKNKTPSLRWTHVPMGCMGETVANVDCMVVRRAAPGGRTHRSLTEGRRERERESDRERERERERHPLPFLWSEGSPTVTGYFPQYTKTLHGYQH